MRDEGIEYDQAHEICSEVEFNFRKGQGGKPILVPGRRRLTKRDLPKLTGEAIFRYVVKTYLKK